jgi:hypothetical protein
MTAASGCNHTMFPGLLWACSALWPLGVLERSTYTGTPTPRLSASGLSLGPTILAIQLYHFNRCWFNWQ